MNEIERAELIQSLKAYLIPTSMFIACLFGAAGTFLIREGELIGWAFIALTVIILVASFVAFITFQNKLRYDGNFVDEDKTARKSAATSASSITTQSETASTATVSSPIPSQKDSVDSAASLNAGASAVLPGKVPDHLLASTGKSSLNEETFDASPEKEAALKKG